MTEIAATFALKASRLNATLLDVNGFPCSTIEYENDQGVLDYLLKNAEIQISAFLSQLGVSAEEGNALVGKRAAEPEQDLKQVPSA